MYDSLTLHPGPLIVTQICNQIYGIPCHFALHAWLLTAADGKAVGWLLLVVWLRTDGWGKGNKIPLSVQHSVPSLTLTTHSGWQESSLGSSRDTDHNVDRWPTRRR